jgi:Tfp pilus assembly protein PilX
MSRSRFRRRSGFVLMTAMVLLAVAMAIVVGWVKIAVLEVRETHLAEDRLQAEWLAESALARAGAKLLADRDYHGETWQVTAPELGRSSSRQKSTASGEAAGPGGLTLISVEPLADRPTARRVRVRADFPARVAADGTSSAGNRVSKQAIFDLRPSAGARDQPTEERP